jgi:hypothetical protein
MSGLNCTVWVYVTRNVTVMKIYCPVPCEDCIFSAEHAAAEEGIFTTLLKEPQAKSWRGRKSSELGACVHSRWHWYSNCTWTTCSACSAPCIRRMLVLGFSYTRLSVRSSTSSLVAILCLLLATRLPHPTINGVKSVWVCRSTFRTPLRYNHHHGLAEN